MLFTPNVPSGPCAPPPFLGKAQTNSRPLGALVRVSGSMQGPCEPGLSLDGDVDTIQYKSKGESEQSAKTTKGLPICDQCATTIAGRAMLEVVRILIPKRGG